MITIVRMVNIVDNWGNTEDVDDIQTALENKEWDDDTVFIDTKGNRYWIDDILDTEVLVAISVKVGNNVVLVKE